MSTETEMELCNFMDKNLSNKQIKELYHKYNYDGDNIGDFIESLNGEDLKTIFKSVENTAIINKILLSKNGIRTIDTLNLLLIHFETDEKYERCAIVKDIIEHYDEYVDKLS